MFAEKLRNASRRQRTRRKQKAEVMAKSSKGGAPKGAAGKAAMPKGPKLGGGGGKR